MNFEERYLSLRDLYKLNAAEACIKSKEMKKEKYTTDEWMEALALCESVAEVDKVNDDVKELFHSLFEDRQQYRVSLFLDEKEYRFWFEQVGGVCQLMLESGDLRTWRKLSGIYENARIPYRDVSKSVNYLQRGVDAEDPGSIALLGYRLCAGQFMEKDPQRGRFLLERAKSLGYQFADLYLCYVDFYYSDPQEDILERIETCVKNLPKGDKDWTLLADYYLQEPHKDYKKALSYINKGIKEDDYSSKFQIARLVLNQELSDLPNSSVISSKKALEHLKEAASYQLLHAIYFLGQYYYYNENRKSIEESEKWYHLGHLYYHIGCTYGMALINLYELNDLEKGLMYLEKGIEENYIPAINEKAYLILDTDKTEKDLKEAKSLLELSVSLGSDNAAYRLAQAYQRGELGEESNYQEAFKYYLVAADLNHLGAIEMVGRYYKGIIGEPNPEKTIEYYKKAISMGSNYARVEMAFCYESGFGVKQDYNKAFKLFKEAESDGYTYASIRLGYYYMNGVIGEPNYEKAFDAFTKAANENFAEGYYNLGRMYKYAMGRPENPALAIENYRKAMELGDYDAYIEMALAYENEYADLEFDPEIIMNYMKVAADEGIPYAQYKMGYYYYYGLVDEDIEKGLEYLQKAYEQGSPLAALTIGDHYLYGRGEEDESDLAITYYQVAEKQDYVSEGIGLCYQYGIGVEQNFSEAFKFFTIAADRGYSAAQYRLALAYKYGRGTTENMQEAFKWFSEAASNNYLNAKYELGLMYLNGIGTEQNKEKGVDFLLSAAEGEQDDAQYELGNCFLTGNGVEADDTKAMYWYQKAAENGNEEAMMVTGKRKRKK